MQEEQKEQTRKRRRYTAAEFAEVWDRWGRGESSKTIARVMGRGASVYTVLLRCGGIRPRVRCRSPQALTLAEREEVSRGLACGQSLRQIARRLARAPSTLSREVRRNGGSNRYRAAEADKQARKRAQRPKSCRLLRCPQLRQLVEEKLREDWSPQQIAGWLKRTYPGRESLYVSHETIYRSLFIQARGALKKELTLCLRSKRTIRRSPQASRKGRGGGQIRDLISISERPASVEDRAVPGHWEGDLLAGSNNTYIAHPGRTSHPLCDVGEGLRQGHRNRRLGADRARPAIAGRALQVADLGPRAGDGRPQTLHPSDGHRRVLLRSAEPLATRIEREHERSVETVLPQGNRLIRTLTRAPGQDRSQAERSAPQDAGV